MTGNLPEDGPQWYGVRSVVHFPDSDTYEERITLWDVSSFDEAIERATAENREYVVDLEAVDTGLYQAFLIDDQPRAGAEVFSLMRTSTLAPDEYVDRFFDTGAERQRLL